jgi:hypothetical protein
MKRSGPRKTYKGKIKPETLKNPQKYAGDIDNISYKSMWERNVIYWLDENPNVVEYAYEELYFPYDNPITGKRSKYYPDFYVKMVDGVSRVIEVKPLKEVEKPKEPKRKTKSYANALATWVINQEKWKSARYYCEKHKTTFEVWNENTLNEMGIMRSNGQMLREGKRKPRNGYTKPKRRS